MTHSSYDDISGGVTRVDEVQKKLEDCRRKLNLALSELDEKFPKSIFDNMDLPAEEDPAESIESETILENDNFSVLNRTLDDKISESYEVQSSIPDTSPPTSPPPYRRDQVEGESNMNSFDVASNGFPPTPSSRPSLKSRPNIKSEMMKLFKITTGTAGMLDSKSRGAQAGNRDVNEVIPVVTSVPRDSRHALLLLFRLELPKSLGAVSRLAVNADGFIAGCTVHGEIFIFSKVPYSRFPDSITRGHDGGVVSLTWLNGPDLGSFFVTNGVDKKTLIWQVTERGVDGPCCEIRQPAVPTCCCIHPLNKDIIVIGLLDNTLAMYKVEKIIEGNVNEGDALVRMVPLGIGATFTKPITALAVSPDGRRLAVGSSVGTIGFFDLNTMSLDAEVDCRNRQGKTSTGRKVVGLNWSKDSTCVLVSSCDSRIRVVLVSDLSRRTKFKSNFYVNENIFLSAVFGPPDDERIVAVSESGHLCIWNLHTSSKTNESCTHCSLIDGGVVSKVDKDKPNTIAAQITSAALVPASDPFCDAFQAKTFALGDGFRRQNDMAFVVSDTSGTIRIFAELYTPS